MYKKRLFYWMIGIPVLVIMMLIIIVIDEKVNYRNGSEEEEQRFKQEDADPWPFSGNEKNIRVLIMDSEHKSIYHKSVSLLFNSNTKMVLGKEEKMFKKGSRYDIEADNEDLKKGSVCFIPEDKKNGIYITSIQRTQGTPLYGGEIELKETKDGLVIINEIYIEEYLKRVVPSEMPASYEKEALKAQAVCARTYAYRQIQNNVYKELGAHVDDSTNFQVYNNIDSQKSTDEAVEETKDEFIMYGNKYAESFYFSTSCGHTTDGTLWGASKEQVPYLRGKLNQKDGVKLNLGDEVRFEKFIRSREFPSYDAEYPYYRWSADLNGRQLQEKIPGIGMIKGVYVTKRATGGIALKIKVVGEDGSKMIEGQQNIRDCLGYESAVITKYDGSKTDGWKSLPSAYIVILDNGENSLGEKRLKVLGGGYGHGVGMSQNGAQGMAKQGSTYQDILQFYFKGVKIEKVMSQADHSA